MSENEKEKIDKELEIHISLENFRYSGTTADRSDKSSPSNFFGRIREKDRLLDYLKNGKNQGKSFLVAGYRGVGKTRFVNEVLDLYTGRKKDKKVEVDEKVKIEEGNQQKQQTKRQFSKSSVVEVRINLGSDGDLSSKSVLFNIVSLLDKELDKTFRWVSFWLDNFFPKFFIVTVLYLIFRLSTGKEIDSLAAISCIVVFFIFIWSLLRDGKIPCSVFSCWNAFVELRTLQNEIYSTTENHAQVKSAYFYFGKKIIASQLTTNQIETRLRNILKDLKGKEVIFVFDELDKLTGGTTDKKEVNLDLIKESKLRKQQVDSILGDLKNLITNSNARYIFIAGRDMYDAYLSERGSSNSLYESLFNDHIYIPSLLTDRSDGEIYLLDSMIEAFVVSNLIPKVLIEETPDKKEQEAKDESRECMKELSHLKLSDYVDSEKNKIEKEVRKKFDGSNQTEQCKKEIELKKGELIKGRLLKEIYILKTLIHFLTLHSWGNCKRLFTLFESFVRKEKGEYVLYFSTRDIQRLVLASQLYILFHHNLSRMLIYADDKLVVSSFSIFHYILKYHGIGFSREHILRMYETINIHSSPELTRIVDIIIHNVLLNHVRRVRNSFYQYRFTFLYEKEIHYITTINDGESAAFNFSLNAMDAVKQHYKNLIVESKHTRTDEEYGRATLASIHVIVGNFHFWEQSFDEASVHYGIALDMLEKNGGLTGDPAKMDLAIQMIEVYLKQGSAAERVNDYLTAAAVYLNAESLAKNCLKNIKKCNVNCRDSKWDILRQPEWARKYLNLKQSAIHYSRDERSLLDSTPDVSDYRKAVLLFFMEDFKGARTAFMNLIDFLRDEKDAERKYFLQGNAFLKAGFSLFLEFSSNLQKKIKPDSDLKYLLQDLLIYDIYMAFHGIENFVLLDESNLSDELPLKINIDMSSKGVLHDIIRLINLSAISFECGKLYSNAAISYLSMVMVWEAFLEALPWKKSRESDWYNCLAKEGKENYKYIEDTIKKVRFSENDNWIFKAQQKAFDLSGLNTGEAYHHSMKSVLERNLKKKLIEKESFFGKRTQRERILKNKELLFQHFSLFGQVIAASMYWEEIAANNMRNEHVSENLVLLEGTENELLPYGTRQYSMMLWLKGRVYLNELLRKKTMMVQSSTETISLEDNLEVIAANAIVNLFRSSQYVVKTHGETSNMILPPLFIIYYNIWEVLIFMVEQEFGRKDRNYNELISFEQAVYAVRFKLGNQLKKKNIKDVSSRVLDLLIVKDMAVEQYKIIEKIGDLSSRDRTSILRNRYYLDDDYEDNMFILDWSYCRFFAPSAVVHGKVIEYRMKSLRDTFDKWC